MPGKRSCVECGRPRDPYRPVRREVDGFVVCACRACWVAYDYDRYLWPAARMSTEDRAAVRRFR